MLWHGAGRPVINTFAATATLLSCAVNVGAQVNIETLRGQDAERKVATSIDLRLEYRSGNVDLATLDLDARTDFTATRAHAFVLLRGGVGLLGGERFANAGLAHVRLMYGSGRAIPEVFAQGDYDKSRKLDARVLGGGGVRLKLYVSGKRILAWGSSWMLEHERYDLDSAAQHPTRATVHRWSNYLVARREFGADASVSWIAYVQPRLDAFEDLRVLVDASVGVGITARLAMTTTFHLRYDSEPPDDIEALDMTLAAGVQIVF
jgi:hypothetical protein